MSWVPNERGQLWVIVVDVVTFGWLWSIGQIDHNGLFVLLCYQIDRYWPRVFGNGLAAVVCLCGDWSCGRGPYAWSMKDECCTTRFVRSERIISPGEVPRPGCFFWAHEPVRFLKHKNMNDGGKMDSLVTRMGIDAGLHVQPGLLLPFLPGRKGTGWMTVISQSWILRDEASFMNGF